jgi:hypothetical protein
MVVVMMMNVVVVLMMTVVVVLMTVVGMIDKDVVLLLLVHNIPGYSCMLVAAFDKAAACVACGGMWSNGCVP